MIVRANPEYVRRCCLIPPPNTKIRFTLRKTHHGPIVVREDPQHFLSARVAGLQDTVLLNQSLQMIRARDLGDLLDERRAAERQVQVTQCPA
jgi:acyl-homoserine lactone acylase PvdQ